MLMLMRSCECVLGDGAIGGQLIKIEQVEEERRGGGYQPAINIMKS